MSEQRVAPLDIGCHIGVVSPVVSAEMLAMVLPALAELGYRRVVLPRLDVAEDELADLRSAIESAGLSPIAMAGLAPGHDVGSEDADERRRGSRMLRDALDVAVALGADQLNGVPYGLFGEGRPRDRERFLRAAQVVGEIADEAHERGVTMTFEVLNRYETSMINTAQDAVDFVAASGSRFLRIHLDTFHMAVEEEGIEEAIERALPWLAYLELGQSGRGDLRSGAIDVSGIITAALNLGYEGRWGVEAFSRSLLAPSAADRLRIWRSTYEDGLSVAGRAQLLIRTGWGQSIVGRRARREARAGR